MSAHFNILMDISHADELAVNMHRRKTKHYQQIVQSAAIPLRKAAADLIFEARAPLIALAVVIPMPYDDITALLQSQLGKMHWIGFRGLVRASRSQIKNPHKMGMRLRIPRLFGALSLLRASKLLPPIAILAMRISPVQLWWSMGLAVCATMQAGSCFGDSPTHVSRLNYIGNQRIAA